MDAFKISVKLFVENDSFGPDEFVPVFHRWIQDHVLDDHLLIDVADYAHVPSGPGTLLVTHEANIHMDRTGNRLGLLYVRKTPLPGSFADRLKAVLASAFNAADKLEQEPGLQGRLKFRTDEISIKLHDRLLAPNTPETFTKIKPTVESLAKGLFDNASVEPAGNAQQLTEVVIKSASKVAVSQLLAKLAPVTV